LSEPSNIENGKISKIQPIDKKEITEFDAISKVLGGLIAIVR
jgi:hypothetical protein